MAFQSLLDQALLEPDLALHAAIFCDPDGERVAAAAGTMAAFDVDVLGASLAVAASRCEPGHRMRVRLGDHAVWLVPVDLGYYAVVIGTPGREFALARRLGELAITLRDAM